MKDKKYHKTRDHNHYTREYSGTAYIKCNLKCSVPKRSPIVFHNESNCDYHSIKNKLAKECKKQFTCLGENTEKNITFAVPIEKKLEELIKMVKNLRKIYLTYYNLIAQDLWQVHYQILSIIFLDEFVELNVNMNMIIKSASKTELNTKIATVFLNTNTLKMI